MFISGHFVGIECKIGTVMARLRSNCNLEWNWSVELTINVKQQWKCIHELFEAINEQKNVECLGTYLCMISHCSTCHNRCMNIIIYRTFTAQWYWPWTFRTWWCFTWNTFGIVITQYCTWKFRKNLWFNFTSLFIQISVVVAVFFAYLFQSNCWDHHPNRISMF